MVHIEYRFSIRFTKTAQWRSPVEERPETVLFFVENHLVSPDSPGHRPPTRNRSRSQVRSKIIRTAHRYRKLPVTGTLNIQTMQPSVIDQEITIIHTHHRLRTVFGRWIKHIVPGVHNHHIRRWTTQSLLSGQDIIPFSRSRIENQLSLTVQRIFRM